MISINSLSLINLSLKEMKELLNDKEDELEDCKESLELAHFKI